MKKFFSLSIITVVVLLGAGCNNQPQPPTDNQNQNPPPTSTSGETPAPAPKITAEPVAVLGDVRNLNVQPGQLVTSGFTVKGEAKGFWFFEAVIGVVLYGDNGEQLTTQNYGQAKGEWMTENFVPFEGKLDFKLTPQTPDTGFIIIHNDNPSGMPENDKLIKIPVKLR